MVASFIFSGFESACVVERLFYEEVSNAVLAHDMYKWSLVEESKTSGLFYLQKKTLEYV